MRRANGRAGGKPRVLRDIVKAFRRPHRFARCRFACPTGTAVSQGFRAAHNIQTGRMATDVPHRHATRSWPKALGSRLYGSLSTRLGIRTAARLCLRRWLIATDKPALRCLIRAFRASIDRVQTSRALGPPSICGAILPFLWPKSTIRPNQVSRVGSAAAFYCCGRRPGGDPMRTGYRDPRHRSRPEFVVGRPLR